MNEIEVIFVDEPDDIINPLGINGIIGDVWIHDAVDEIKCVWRLLHANLR